MNKIKIIAVLALIFSVFPQDSQAWGSVKDKIYAAAKAGDVRTIENYLYQGYSIDATDSDGMTALCSASWDYSPYAYDLLISYGANPNANCMYFNPRTSSTGLSSSGYLIAGGVALAVGGGVAALAAGGGGGGGSSSSDTSSGSGSSGSGSGDSGSGSSGSDSGDSGSGSSGSGSGDSGSGSSGSGSGDSGSGSSGSGSGDSGSGSSGSGSSDSGSGSSGSGSGESGSGSSGSGSGDSGSGSSGSGSGDSGSGSSGSSSGDSGSSGSGSGDSGSGSSGSSSGDSGSGSSGSGSGDSGSGSSGSGSGDSGSGSSGSGSGDSDSGSSDSGSGDSGSGSSGSGSGDSGSGSSGSGSGDSGSGSGSSITLYDEDFFRNNYEFNSGRYGANSYYGAVKFLSAINAAPAYSRYYGSDAFGNFVTKLTNTTTVGIIDTGVDGSHDEFSDGKGGSKVSGYNFDYGPCNGSDRKNCWLFNGSDTITFYNAEGQNSHLSYSVSYDSYLAWYKTFPSGYNWDVYKERSDSFYPVMSVEENPLSGAYYAHGTNVAGIIAANHDDEGMMGVAFTNTYIKAIRWDLLSSIEEPVKALVDDNVVAINLSIGTTASIFKSSYNYNTGLYQMLHGWKEAAKYTIDNYEYYNYGSKTYKEGPIWVKAAGNVSSGGYSHPDLESGIKLISSYSDLMMLVVVNADVTMDSNGHVTNYSLDTTSNKCGNTSSYCIAAPGTLIASTDVGSGYILMGGTSQAAPVVAGAIAFLKNAFPSLHSEQIVDLLLNTANKNASDYSASIYGAGLLDLGEAVSYQSPVGTSSIVTVSGDNLSSPYIRLDDASLVVSSAMSEALQKALPESITAFDAYDRPYEYPTATYVRSSHAGYKNLKSDVLNVIPVRQKRDEVKGNIHFAYASGGTGNKPLNYMMSEYRSGRHSNGFYFSSNSKYRNINGKHADLNNPYMSFDSAYGYVYGYNINPKLKFNIEVTGGQNGLYDGDNDYNDGNFKKPAYGFNSSVEYNYGSNVKFGVSSGMLYENDALLGSNGYNAFALDGGQTYHIGLNAIWNIGKKWSLSGSYYQGYTQAQKLNSGLLKTSDLVSNGYAAELNYAHNDSLNLGFRVSSPLRIEKGRVNVDFASGRDTETDTVYRNRYTASLKPAHREYKFAVYADKDLNEDVSVSSEFDVRVNPEHSSASNDYRALFGLSWNF